jgi:hypothetical protein
MSRREMRLSYSVCTVPLPAEAGDSPIRDITNKQRTTPGQLWFLATGRHRETEMGRRW